MRIEALGSYGIDEQVIALWRAAGHEELLPVQERAIRECGVLSGNNLLVFSPTSSGKTFVGEVAAIRVARQNQRAIYLVPQKALAEEKYEEFRSRYSPLGVRVVISTRDRKEFDRDISRGEFHVAVIVFEKMQSLLVNSPGLLRKVGLVVMDELQMIGDKTRGPKIELLLTKIKISPGRPQIIGLSAVLANAGGLSDWLGASLCATERRPVELRKGVLCQGVFRYVEHNSGKEGREALAPVARASGTRDILVSQVKAFVDAREQCLIFCKSRLESMQTAEAVASRMTRGPAAEALAELQDLEESEGKDQLAALLARGVAYHNADLDWDQRHLIEKWFRRGDISVVCATTTLAMGMNLPAKNVFIDPERWEHPAHSNWITMPISQAEYENMSGRAGRLGIEEEFGRAIIVTGSPFQANVFYDQYARGTLGELEPALDDDPLAHHVLNLVASGLAATEAEMREVLLASYTGQTCWRGGEREREFDGKLAQGLKHCLDGGLVERADGKFRATKLGQLAAVKGVTVDTAIALAEFARENQAHAADVHLLEILLCLAGTEDGERIYFNLATAEHNSGKYFELLGNAVNAMPAASRARLADYRGMSAVSYDLTKRVKKALLLYQWALGLPTREIETRFHCYSGSIAGLAGEFAWLAETFSGIAKLCEWPEPVVKGLAKLSERLVHGVPEEGIVLANARVRGLRRGRIAALIEHGIDTLEKVTATAREAVEKLITRPVAARLLDRIALLAQRKLARGEGQVAAKDDAGEPPVEVQAEWTSEYLPADDAGVTYRSGVKIHLDGRADKRRHLVRVGGKDAWLTGGSFEAALKLAVAARTTPLGWVSCGDLGSPDTYHQVIRRLKDDLSVGGMDVEALIENSGAKQYRFSVPPANVSIDARMIKRHFPEGARLLPRADKPPAS